MARMNRKYDKAFKLEAIQLYETSGKSVSQIETELVITSCVVLSTLREAVDKDYILTNIIRSVCRSR